MQVTLLKNSCFVSEGIIMSFRQLMPSLGEELDNLWARVIHLEARVRERSTDGVSDGGKERD